MTFSLKKITQIWRGICRCTCQRAI